MAGENLAVRELTRRGYAVLARRYRTRHGEIDLVCRDGQTLVFVEVKARTSLDFGRAAEAVTPWKQHRVAAMAADYLARHHLIAVPCRFDVVTVDDAGGAPVVTLFENAFGAG
jgi:putative endonuclease